KQAMRRMIRIAEGRLVGRRILRGVITYSQEVRRARSSYLRTLALPPDCMPLIYPGLELSRFTPTPASEKLALRRELGIPEGQPLLINVRRLVSFKGQRSLAPLMAEVVRQWPAARLLIAGEGAERQRLAADILAARLGAHIVLLGSRADVPRLLAAADLFVFPS